MKSSPRVRDVAGRIGSRHALALDTASDALEPGVQLVTYARLLVPAAMRSPACRLTPAACRHGITALFRPVTVTNTGGGYLGFSSASVDDTTNFALENIGASTLLGSGAGRELRRVRFKPTTGAPTPTTVRVFALDQRRKATAAPSALRLLRQAEDHQLRPRCGAVAGFTRRLDEALIRSSPSRTPAKTDLAIINNIQFISGDVGDFGVVTALPTDGAP